MRAAVYRSFGGPIIVESVPIPSPPSDGVLIAVRATGVCRSDWHGWKGHDSDIIDHGLPLIPGHEVSGVVVGVGNLTRNFRVGDRVAVPFILSCGFCRECHPSRDRSTVCEQQIQPGFTMMGSFAEYLALPRADRNLSLLPEGVSFVESAALGCRFSTAFRAVLQQGKLVKGQTVGVFGCGGLGLSCIMIAACYGASKIVAVDLSESSLRKSKEIGATHVVDAKETEGVRREVMKLTDGIGVDLAIDAAGFKATCEDSVHCTRRGGRMVQVGLPIGGQNPAIPMGLVAGKEIEIVGSHGCAASDLPNILALVADGKLDPKKLVEREVGLEQGAKAIMEMDTSSPLGITCITSFTQSEQRTRSSRL